VADYREAFVGIDVAKLRNAIAIADAGREGEVRFFGEVDASATNMRRVLGRIANRFDRVHFCYEAGLRVSRDREQGFRSLAALRPTTQPA
jgi:hypothetical protein